MSESLFTVAVALTSVFALLSECASDLAIGISTAFAVAVPLLCGAIQLVERKRR